MRAWWEKRSKIAQALVLCMGMMVLYGFTYVTAMLGSMTSKESDTHAFTIFFARFFGFFPIWFAVISLSGFLNFDFKKRSLILLILIGLFVSAFWPIWDQGTVLAPDDVYSGLIDTLINGNWLFIPPLSLIGFILALLFLPKKFRFQLFVVTVIISMASVVGYVSITMMAVNQLNKLNHPDPDTPEIQGNLSPNSMQALLSPCAVANKAG